MTTRSAPIARVQQAVDRGVERDGGTTWNGRRRGFMITYRALGRQRPRGWRIGQPIVERWGR